jgi:hypothetical protein
MDGPAATEGHIEVPGGRVWYRIVFIEERAHYLQVVGNFLTRVEARSPGRKP